MKNNIVLHIQEEIEKLKADKAVNKEKIILTKAQIDKYPISYQKNKEKTDEYIDQLYKNIQKCDDRIKAFNNIKRTIKSSNTKIKNRIEKLPELKAQAERLQTELISLKSSSRNKIKNNKSEIKKISKKITSLENNIKLYQEGEEFYKTITEEIYVETNKKEALSYENKTLLDIVKIKEKEFKNILKQIKIVDSAKKTRRNAVEKFLNIKNKPITRNYSKQERKTIYEEAHKAYANSLAKEWTTADALDAADKVAEKHGLSFEELEKEFVEKATYNWEEKPRVIPDSSNLYDKDSKQKIEEKKEYNDNEIVYNVVEQKTKDNNKNIVNNNVVELKSTGFRIKDHNNIIDKIYSKIKSKFSGVSSSKLNKYSSYLPLESEGQKDFVPKVNVNENMAVKKAKQKAEKGWQKEIVNFK